MSDYHEPTEQLPEEVKNVVRALSSLKEEIEAISWYHQREAVCKDIELKKILAHNRDEEIEHACMTLEWLRRNMPSWDDELKTYLFTTKSIIDVEESEDENNVTEINRDTKKMKSLGLESLNFLK